MNPAELFRQDNDAVNVSPGEVLFREGELGNHMFVVLEGMLDIMVGTKVVETAMSGALIGEMALIDNAPRSATVTARTQCRLAKIDLRRFHFMVQQNPYFASHVMKVLVERIRKMDQLLQQS
ncbi:MAG: putative transcriptional regulator, Crp/Fnr family [Pedosphaera sp.]|jgi:CRP/FNR family cyclic AMP-dependent transcriptional regulator|nr:putative transcriptional regulator, Crp/Fnr family [Pedosphaera sp.]